MENVMITGNAVQQSVIKNKLETVSDRCCSICMSPLAFIFKSESEGGEIYPYYDTNCECVSYETEPRRKEWDELATCINMQRSASGRKIMLKLFGMDENL